MSVKFDRNRLLIGTSALSMHSNGGATTQIFQINSIDDRYASIFQAPYDITISHLGFGVFGRVGTPVQHRISLQGITSGGLPDGIIKLGGDAASLFTPPIDVSWDKTWQWSALDVSYAASAGEFLCVVIEPVGTPDVSNNSTFNARINYFHTTAFPVALTQTNGAAWVKQTANTPMFGIKNSDASLVAGIPLSNTTLSDNINITGHRLAMKFVPPPCWDHLDIMGLRLTCAWTNGGQVKVSIWDTDDNVLGSNTLDTDFHADSNPNSVYEVFFDSPTIATLEAGQTYYAGIECIDNFQVFLGVLRFTDNADMESMACGKGYISSRFDGTSWTDDDINRPLIDLICDNLKTRQQTVDLSAATIPSEESWGTPRIQQKLTVLQINSEESWGTPVVTQAQAIYPPSIPSEEDWGTPTIINNVIHPISIPSAESWGIPRIVTTPHSNCDRGLMTDAPLLVRKTIRTNAFVC